MMWQGHLQFVSRLWEILILIISVWPLLLAVAAYTQEAIWVRSYNSMFSANTRTIGIRQFTLGSKHLAILHITIHRYQTKETS